MPPKKGGQTNRQQATTGYLRNKLQSGDPNSLAKKMDQLMARIPRGTFASVGGALGGPAGAMVGRGMSAITGYGDYTVKANSLSNSTMIGEMADQVPVFKQQGADIRVRHCEFVTDLVVPADKSAFNSTTLDIDPTSTVTFPWLASVASKYQKFKVKGMVIGFRSTSTDYNNSGVVAIAVNYDPAETAYASMTDLLNSKFAVSTKPSNSMLAPVECDPGRSPQDGYYVKHVTSSDVSEAAIRQTVMGKINVATSGLTLDPGATVGQIYVSYDIEFLYPYMHVAAPSPGPGPSPGPTGYRSGYVGAAIPYTSQTLMSQEIINHGEGQIEGWNSTDVLTTTNVMVKRLNSPDNTELPWFSLVLPVGQFEITTFDTGIYQPVPGAAAGALLVGTVYNETHGSAITTSAATTTTFGAATGGYYTVTVAAGTEAERTLTPHQQFGRTTNAGGVTTHSGLAIAYREITT